MKTVTKIRLIAAVSLIIGITYSLNSYVAKSINDYYFPDTDHSYLYWHIVVGSVVALYFFGVFLSGRFSIIKINE